MTLRVQPRFGQASQGKGKASFIATVLLLLADKNSVDALLEEHHVKKCKKAAVLAESATGNKKVLTQSRKGAKRGESLSSHLLCGFA